MNWSTAPCVFILLANSRIFSTRSNPARPGYLDLLLHRLCSCSLKMHLRMARTKLASHHRRNTHTWTPLGSNLRSRSWFRATDDTSCMPSRSSARSPPCPWEARLPAWSLPCPWEARSLARFPPCPMGSEVADLVSSFSIGRDFCSARSGSRSGAA